MNVMGNTTVSQFHRNFLKHNGNNTKIKILGKIETDGSKKISTVVLSWSFRQKECLLMLRHNRISRNGGVDMGGHFYVFLKT